MGAMGAMVPVGALACPGSEGLLLSYRACLRASLHHLLEVEGAPTTDPRVLSLTAHLTRRQAAVELEEEVRRAPLAGADAGALRKKLVEDFFRGVDLHYM